MKKITTTLAFLTFVIFGYSQNIILLDDNNNVISNTIIDISIDSSTSITKEIFVKNSSINPDTIKVTRTMSVATDDRTQFCWGGLCYLYTTNTSSLSLIIAGGDTVDFAENGFHAIFNSGLSNITRLVHYRFYNIHNFSDSVGVTLRYLSSTGIDELTHADGDISNGYPNPANSMVSFKYNLNEYSEGGKIVFYNMLGKVVKQIILNDKQGTAKINIADLDSGIYFYSFVEDNKIVSTKKLWINH
jgi:hypothetical protein